MNKEKFIQLFVQFLKDNNFYDGWIEGYNLDNKICGYPASLNEFYEYTDICDWLYSGPLDIALPEYSLVKIPESFEEQCKQWRDKYSNIYYKLGLMWKVYVYKFEDKEKIN